jgi:hypothetical protein
MTVIDPSPPIDRRRAQQARREAQTDRIVFWGWIACVLLWPAGLVLAIITLVRGRTKHGVWMLVLCVVLAFVSLAIIGPAMDSKVGGFENADMESQIKSGLIEQLPDQSVESVDCVGAGERSGSCIAQIDGQTYGIDVTSDSDTGEFIWRMQ